MDVLKRWRLDAFLVTLATIEAVVIATSAGPGRLPGAAATSAAALVLIARRWNPLAASVLALIGLTIGLASLSEGPSVVFFGLMATFAIAAAINSTRDAIIAWVVGAILIGLGVVVAAPPGALGDFLLTLSFCTVMWVAGWLVSRHTRRAEVMELRAEVAERQQRDALRQERARIARELHDVVSHGLSVVVLQTLAARGALADLATTGTDRVDRHLDAVESTARDALGEMRRMLGLLQIDDLDGSDVAPPSLGVRHLPGLVDRARSAGLLVDDSGIGTGEPLSSGLELTIYRVVQEALTNAAKHAPGAHVDIVVAVENGHATVAVTNDAGSGPAATFTGGGHGLTGMRERVRLYDGIMVAEPVPGGGFALRVSLPIETPVPAAVTR